MKVFSIDAFKNDEAFHKYGVKYSMKLGWPQKLDGKTIEEIKELGYSVSPKWMVDKEEKK